MSTTTTIATKPNTVRMAAVALCAGLILAITGVGTTATPAGASTGHRGWTTYTENMNKRETKAVAKYGFWPALAGGYLPGWAKLAGVYAAWITWAAGNAVNENKCLRFTYYYVGSVVYPGTYSGRDCR